MSRAATRTRLHQGFDLAQFAEERPSDDPDTVSIRAICRHVGSAAFGYANHLRRAQGRPIERPSPDPKERIETATDIRPVLADALRFTEETVDPLRGLDRSRRWRGDGNDPDPRYQVALRIGRRYEPWIEEISPLPLPPAR